MIPKSTRVIPFCGFVLILCLLFTVLISGVNALAYTDIVNSLTTEEQAWLQNNQVVRVHVGNAPPLSLLG